MPNMLPITYQQRRACERLDRSELEALQLGKLNALLGRVLPLNPLVARQVGAHRLPLRSLDELSEFAFSTKADLVGEANDRYAANRTFPLERYVRFHRTSGTHGYPLAVLDTAEDWQWWVETWQFVLDAAELGPQDRVLMAFSFGPFIGFWSAHDAALARGALVIPGGGLSSLARLEMIREHAVTAVFCTPSYALHLVEVGEQHGLDVGALGVRSIIVAGEPGGSVPSIRKRIEDSWQARTIDHAGATEVGPWGYGDRAGHGLRVVETEFIAEFLQVSTLQPASEGELAELVLTSLGRDGCPVLRYRTGDLVRPDRSRSEENQFVLLAEGVLGRVDDMLIVRGVNIYPSAVEQILRSFPEVAEYRLIAMKDGALDALAVEIEDRLADPARVATELRLRLGLRVDVRSVPLGSLPRFEGKARRFIDQRGERPSE
jgi:phenylacetate-CoA ligase